MASPIKTFARNPHEEHRVATPLELFFDLVYVIAIASAGVGLHNMLQEKQVFQGILWFAIAFFAIFWCWLNFAWYASAYDKDDTIFRLTTFLQIFGALVFAVGVSNFFKPDHNFSLAITGYVIMRIALATHWFRAAKFDKPRRNTCLRYAFGIIVMQILWTVGYLFFKQYFMFYMPFLFIGEMAVPVFAEKGFSAQEGTPWHPHHIAERYSLLVIIVLGEGIMATTANISSLVNDETRWQESFALGFAAAALVFSLWWSYFKMPFGKILEQNKQSGFLSFIFGYGHFFVFASLAAVGVGLQIMAGRAESLPMKISDFSTAYALLCVAIPTAIYLLMMSFYRTAMIRRSKYNWISWLVAVILPFVPVFSNRLGLSLEWSLMLSVLAPAAFIFLNSWDDCSNEKAKNFKID